MGLYIDYENVKDVVITDGLSMYLAQQVVCCSICSSRRREIQTSVAFFSVLRNAVTKVWHMRQCSRADGSKPVSIKHVWRVTMDETHRSVVDVKNNWRRGLLEAKK